MTDADKAFFNKLEEAAKKDEHARSKAAAEYLVHLITPAANTPQGINANLLCIVFSNFTGLAVADAAKKLDEQSKAVEDGNAAGTSRIKLETNAGIFWIGDLINQLLFQKQYSVWNIVMSGYSLKKGKAAIPDLGEMIAANAKVMGDPELMLWGGTTNPYIEASEARDGFYGIMRRLEPFKLSVEEYPQAFAMALMDIVMKVEGVFPPELNCVKTAMEFVMFVAHLDI